MEQYEQEQEFAYVTQAKVERISKKALSTVAVLGHIHRQSEAAAMIMRLATSPARFRSR